MINLDNTVNDKKEKHNEKWPYIPDYPYMVLDQEKQTRCLI